VPDSREWTLDGHAGHLVARTWLGGAGPTHVVLLAHGYAEHVGRYEHVAAALVANGAVVYAVDHAGHGKSEGERGVVTDFEPIVDDLHLVDRRAREEHPGLPVVLLGHSMGGLIAARYAQRYAASLAAVVLSGPLVGRYDAGAQLFDLPEFPDIYVDIEGLSRAPEVAEAYASDPLIWHGLFRRDTLQSMLRGLGAVMAGPSLGTLPLLWAHGGADTAVLISESRPGIEHLCGDGYVQRIYPEARHEIFNEINKDEVLTDVTAFINDALSLHER
jgi:alpha-beta hydrolase superfamily lysophospholipase